MANSLSFYDKGPPKNHEEHPFPPSPSTHSPLAAAIPFFPGKDFDCEQDKEENN